MTTPTKPPKIAKPDNTNSNDANNADGNTTTPHTAKIAPHKSTTSPTTNIDTPANTSAPRHYRLYSWNVNGLRAGLRKGTFQSFIADANPDILCLQETKAKPGQAECDLPAYTEFWSSAQRAGYSGTAVFTKTAPLDTSTEFPAELQSSTYPWSTDPCGDARTEGRLQTLEYPYFYLVNVYVPNSKPDLSRLPLRHNIWDPALLQHLKLLEKKKPVVICGDLNVAHAPIDLANPRGNEHNAGYTAEERQGLTNYLNGGFLDTFRTLHPHEIKYTWWSHWARSRERNVGWRIDYFLISKSLRPHLKSAEIHNQFLGSDHCPISIELEF